MKKKLQWVEYDYFINFYWHLMNKKVVIRI